MNSSTRRDFTRNAALAGAVVLARGQAAASSNRPALCLFSKHLPKLNYAELATTVKQMGFVPLKPSVRKASPSP
jgi:hypothetical protein